MKEPMSREIHKSYRDLLKDDRWLAFCDEFKKRHGEQCYYCDSNKSVQVHHLGYKPNCLPWEYTDDELMLLCRECHDELHRFADDLWNEVLKIHNKWLIYECAKAVKEVMLRHPSSWGQPENDIEYYPVITGAQLMEEVGQNINKLMGRSRDWKSFQPVRVRP